MSAVFDLTTQISEASEAIRQRWSRPPRAGIILGTGLGSLASHIEKEASIAYDEIPHFPRSTALGHKGQLVCGSLAGVPVMAMDGRCHLYEDYSPVEITIPVRAMDNLGIRVLIVSNAGGGLNPNYSRGDIVVIDDHVNLTWDNPLVGCNNDRLGPRFPDMSHPFDSDLIDLALSVARRENFVAHRGIYVGLTGPNYETRAEYRFLRSVGDVVGMSTVPEIIVAVHAGLRTLALSAVTNTCSPDNLTKMAGHDVVTAAAAVEPNLRTIIMSVLEQEK